MTGIHLAAFHFNENLVKINVSQSGGINNKLNKFQFYYIYLFFVARYAAILQDTSCLAMLSLFNIPSSDASKLSQRHSQSMFDC